MVSEPQVGTADGPPVALFTSGKRRVVDNRAKPQEIRVLIMGAAGLDFHNFNVLIRNSPGYRAVGFIARQV